MTDIQMRLHIGDLIDEIGPAEAIKRLEGTPPAGSLPASGSGAAEREPSQTRDTCSSSAPPFGGQGTGELRRLVEYLEGQAATAVSFAMEARDRSPATSRHAAQKAAEFLGWASLVGDAIDSPRPQSGAERSPEHQKS